jgi:outer membrane protein OmpA-like peptidoglycan-associated protein
LRIEPGRPFGYKHPSNPGQMMRSLPLAAMAVLCLSGPGLVESAWAVDSGLEVQVNPASATGREVLLYPGGQFMRVVPALRQPGDTGAPIHLHMPARRAHIARAPSTAPAAPPRVARTRPAPAPRVAKPAPAPRVARAASPPPVSPPPPGSAYSGAPGAANLFAALPTISAAPSTPAPPPTPGVEGLAKQGVILFAHDADTPADTAIDSIRLLAGQLNTGLSRAQSRIELMAFGGTKGDKGSDARRLSLKRALAIRQVLIDAGVSSARIDVHAQGGVDDSGPTDRVDVYIRS